MLELSWLLLGSVLFKKKQFKEFGYPVVKTIIVFSSALSSVMNNR